MIFKKSEHRCLPCCRPRYIGLLLTLVVISTATTADADTFRIEIDYMVADGHSHEPNATVIGAVQQMFACQGHTLIIDVSDAITHHDVLRRDPEDCASSLFDYSGSADSFGAIKAAFADHSSDDGWHYCIFAHQYEDSECVTTSSSGLGQLPGWNFIVTLGAWSGQTGTAFDQAATLAHEFGHNLGLTHCGVGDCSGIGNYTPILPSTMSYRYQVAGVRTNLLCNALTVEEALYKEIDYSQGLLCAVDENNLDEQFGTVMTAVDWNCDGSFETGVAHDINGGSGGWCGSTGSRSWIDDTNQWAFISDPGDDSRDNKTEEVSCITWEEWQDVQQEMDARGGCPQPTLTVEPCITGRNVYVGPYYYPTSGGCDNPYYYLQQAHDLAPEHSVFFLKPGTYHDTSVYGTVVLDKAGVYMSNIGTATID